MLKAVLFDMDGVLIDSNKSWYIIFNKTLEHFGEKSISREEFDKVVWAKNFTETAKKYFSVDINKIKDYYGEIYNEFMENLETFPDIKDTLEKLKNKNLKLAVVTNSHYEHAKRILKDLNLVEFFDYIIGGDKVKNGKPEPDLLIKTLEDMKLEKDQTIFIGDTIWDKIAAETAEIKFIGLKIDGDERIENLKELLELI